MPGTYVGLDASDKTTHICVVDVNRKVIWRERHEGWDISIASPELLTGSKNYHHLLQA